MNQHIPSREKMFYAESRTWRTCAELTTKNGKGFKQASEAAQATKHIHWFLSSSQNM
jgi:hypothetical protein